MINFDIVVISELGKEERHFHQLYKMGQTINIKLSTLIERASQISDKDFTIQFLNDNNLKITILNDMPYDLE